MRRAEIVTAIILGIVSVYLMWKSGESPSWNPEVGRFANVGLIEDEGPGSGFWPFWLSLGMLICCIWIGINWHLRKTPASVSEEPFLDAYARKMLVMVGAGLFAFLILIHLTGFYGAMLLFMIYYIRFLGHHTWVLTLSVAVGVTVFSFFFFDIAMRIVLPKGYLEPLFIPLYDIFI